MNDDVFSKYYKRVARRSWVKSIFIGLIAAFFAALVASIFIFIFDDSLYYVAIIVFGGVVAVSIPLLYFLRYRPDRKDVANAVDALGLEERFVTMLELEGSRSYIADRQRRDTYSAAESVPASAIRIAVSTVLLVLLIVSAALGIFMTTYTGLAHADVVPGFGDVVDALTSDDTVEYQVTYEEYTGSSYDGYVVGDGVINGEIVQFVKEGEDCTTVFAEAMDDSVFYMWSDGNTNPERTDKNVKEDMEIFAIFLEVDDGDGDGDGDGQGEGEGEGSGEGDSSEMGEEGAEDGDGEGGGESDNPSDNRNPSGQGAGGGYDQNNNVYQGDTDYTTERDNAMDQAAEDIGSGNYSSGQSSAADSYFDGLW